MGQAKLRIKQIATLKKFQSIVDDFVLKRKIHNRYGGNIFECKNVHRTNTGEYNQCIANSKAQYTDRIGPAVGWIICHNAYDNSIELVPHVWNIDFDRDYMFDTTPFHESIKTFAYVWDSDMYMRICDNQNDENAHHLPGVAQIKEHILGYKIFSVIDKCPITGKVLKSKELKSYDIEDFNWNYEYVNPY